MIGMFLPNLEKKKKAGQNNTRFQGTKNIHTGMGLAKSIKVQGLYVLHQRRPVHLQLAVSSEGQVGKHAFQAWVLLPGSPTPNHVGHPTADNSEKC